MTRWCLLICAVWSLTALAELRVAASAPPTEAPRNDAPALTCAGDEAMAVATVPPRAPVLTEQAPDDAPRPYRARACFAALLIEAETTSRVRFNEVVQRATSDTTAPQLRQDDTPIRGPPVDA